MPTKPSKPARSSVTPAHKPAFSAEMVRVQRAPEATSATPYRTPPSIPTPKSLEGPQSLPAVSPIAGIGHVFHLSGGYQRHGRRNPPLKKYSQASDATHTSRYTAFGSACLPSQPHIRRREANTNKLERRTIFHGFRWRPEVPADR